MNADDLDLLREKILLLCRAASPLGIPPERILRTLQRSAYELDEAALRRELHHLGSAGLIAEVSSGSFTTAIKRYVTTAQGNSDLESRGLLP